MGMGRITLLGSDKGWLFVLARVHGEPMGTRWSPLRAPLAWGLLARAAGAKAEVWPLVRVFC